MRLGRCFHLALFGAALLAAAPPSAAQPAAGDGAWRTYQPPSKVFTAEFPGAPSYESKLVDHGVYKETAHRHWLVQPGRDGALFEVVHLKAPPNDGNVPAGIILDATIDAVTAQHRQRGLREVSRREVILKGCVGREFEAADAHGVSLRGRVFIVGEQILTAVYAGPAHSAARQQEARRFLDSVTAAGSCAPPPAAPPEPEVKKLGKVSGPVDAASGWMLIEPGQSRFSALMPGAAEAEEEQAQQKPYPLSLRTYSAERDEALYIVVECGDFPEEMNRLAHFEEMKFSLGYRGLASEAEKLGVRIIPEGNVQVGGHQGRQYRLASDDMTGRALIVSTPEKFYMFAAFAAGPDPPAADFARFFSSIKITRP